MGLRVRLYCLSRSCEVLDHILLPPHFQHELGLVGMSLHRYRMGDRKSHHAIGRLSANFILLELVYRPRWREMSLRSLLFLYRECGGKCGDRRSHSHDSNADCLEVANAKFPKAPSLRDILHRWSVSRTQVNFPNFQAMANAA